MIENLTVGRSAYFFSRKRQLSQNAIERLFRSLRVKMAAPSQNLFRMIRSQVGGALYSAICFSFERPVAFLDTQAGQVERVFGFLMLVEKSQHVAVLKNGLDLPAAFKTRYLGRLANERIERAIAREDAVFEQLRLKNMSTSKFALRLKSFESNDLANTVPVAGASRFVPQGYRVRLSDGSYSATPSTGRISTRADRVDHAGIVGWASTIIDLLEVDEAPIASFIRNFAKPLKLDAITPDVEPTFVAIDVPSLAEALLDIDAPLRLVAHRDDALVELTRVEIAAILAALDESFPIRRNGDGLQIRSSDDQTEIGRIRIGKTRIALQQLALPLLERVHVEDRSFHIGDDAGSVSLVRYIDKKDLFTVLFSDIALAYVDGMLFRDSALVGGGADFMRHLDVEPDLATSTSEKGTFTAGQDRFSPNSVFRTVVDRIANDCDILICDDLGDEWADFIGLSTTARPRVVSFYHAKHGKCSLGASPFHEAVGQALKNLGRMALAIDAMPAKFESWVSPYRNEGVTTAISRLVRGGTAAEIDAGITSTRAAPDLVKQVFIVTSSLSKAAVAQVFAEAENGVPPPAHFVQLYWLLTTYFAACVEMGAVGYVVCQP